MIELAVGLMSGTSLDGVDAALVRFTGDPPTVELLEFLTVPYTVEQQDRLTAVLERGTARECALLNVDLGHAFAEATLALLDRASLPPTRLAFVASHGQTIWHEPGAATLQLGDPAVIAERVGVTVVSDFRSRDVAAGGQGAPLVSMADATLFAAADAPRLLLNIGGIANATWVPPGGDPDGVIAFDTGPGVAVIDAVVRLCDPTARFDAGGVHAARGAPDRELVSELLQDAYFDTPPPKSTGRERYGDEFAAQLVGMVRARRPDASDDDCIATAVVLTVRSIAEQLRRWTPPSREVVISGGGARNKTLMAALRNELTDREVQRFSDQFFDGDAKEAVAFALLGWLTMRHRAGNVPAATGASGARRLGRVTPP